MKTPRIIGSRKAAALGAIVAWAFSTASNAQNMLFNQPFGTDGNLTSSGGEAEFIGYDDFSLSSGGTINQVNWWGLDFGGITGFTVSFWTDQGGLPGAPLVSESISGLAGETYAGMTPMARVPIDAYSSALPTPFTAAPGSPYLISIVASSGDWCWEDSDVGNNGVEQWEHTSYHHFGYAGMAFSLAGTAVPERGIASLALFGGLALLVCRRNKVLT